MKFMVTWKIPTDSYKEAVEAFLNSGAPMPAGLTSLGRWHAPGSRYGWLLVETDDAVTLAEHMTEWASLLELNISPVIADEEAVQAATKVYRS
ncbi:MAG: DUF3303 domain-containing protein [Desulforhopalus sp.]